MPYTYVYNRLNCACQRELGQNSSIYFHKTNNESNKKVKHTYFWSCYLLDVVFLPPVHCIIIITKNSSDHTTASSPKMLNYSIDWSPLFWCGVTEICVCPRHYPPSSMMSAWPPGGCMVTVLKYWWMLSSPQLSVWGAGPGHSGHGDSRLLDPGPGGSWIMQQLEQRRPLPWSPGDLVLVVTTSLTGSVSRVVYSPLPWHQIMCLSAPDVTRANEGMIEMTNSYLITNCQVPGVDILTPA